MKRPKSSAETLDELLLARGIGITDLAKLAGISPVTLYNWRRGIREPRIPQMVKLAKALQVPTERVAAAVRASAAAAK